MSNMRVVQVSTPNGPFEIVERERPEPARNAVRVAVEACGICHSDTVTKLAAFPGMSLPRVPGHEVIGRIDAIGPDVEGWTIGQRVGVGWYGEYMIAPVSSLARVPDGLSATDAAPLMCAGVTTFNALRNSGARSGDLVAVHGLGGLGHLGVQFAKKMGFHTVAVARGADKAELAASLGADRYIDSTAEDPAKALSALGGARIVLATVTDGNAMSALISGLGIEGSLLVLGAPHAPLAVSAFALIMGCRRVAGWYS